MASVLDSTNSEHLWYHPKFDTDAAVPWNHLQDRAKSKPWSLGSSPQEGSPGTNLTVAHITSALIPLMMT